MYGEARFYFDLMWLFVFVITFLMLLLSYLYFAKRRAQKNERLSLAFSHQVIEGMEMERLRIARELHDSVLPQVLGMSAADQIRTICVEMMPPDFSRLSLNDLFADICNKFAKRTGLECSCFIENELLFSNLSAEHKLHLYRMVQECFTNIEKHSRAHKALLVARRNNGNILICVSDDGEGFVENSKKDGLGMMSLRQRAVIIGANIDFISESQNGFMVRIELITLPNIINDSE
ncbi:MAG: histidine kinase [Treponema sp.]|nr:histidine kinase [Treponema sp.]